MQNKTLIIAGMHRSGTSLITTWLHKCGLIVGEQLLGPAIGNKEGHFEDVEFLKMHEEILRDNHLPSTGITDIPVEHISAYHKEKIKCIVAVKNSRFEQWGWKEPRTCLFLDLYREVLPDANYLVIARSYQSVIISLIKRMLADLDEMYNVRKGYFSRWVWYKLRHKYYFKRVCRRHAEFFLKVWISYNEQVLKNIKALPADKYLVINYTSLITDDRDVISYLTNNWGLALNYSSFKDVFKESLLSQPFDIEKYINDKQLLNRAKDIERSLADYMHL